MATALSRLSGALPGAIAATIAGALAPGDAAAKLAVAGVLALPFAGASLLASSARAEGDEADAADRWAIGAGAAVLLAVPALNVLATVLKATTHHRALGGTTFGVVAAITCAGAVAAGVRASSWVARRSWARPAALGSVALVLIVAAWIFSRAGLLAPSRADAALLSFALAAAWLSRARSTALGVAALALVLVMSAAGVALAAGDAGAVVARRGAIAGYLVRAARPTLQGPPAAAGHDAEGVEPSEAPPSH